MQNCMSCSTLISTAALLLILARLRERCASSEKRKTRLVAVPDIQHAVLAVKTLSATFNQYAVLR